LSETGLLYDGQSIHSPTNAALVLENIKQEVESFDTDYLEEKTPYSTRRRLSTDVPGVPGVDAGFDSVRHSLKACKTEGDTLGDGADTIFTLFASLLDSSLQGNASMFLFMYPSTWIKLFHSSSFSHFCKCGYKIIALKLEIPNKGAFFFFYLLLLFVWNLLEHSG